MNAPAQITGWEWDNRYGQQPADEHVRAHRALTEGPIICPCCGTIGCLGDCPEMDAAMSAHEETQRGGVNRE